MTDIVSYGSRRYCPALFRYCHLELNFVLSYLETEYWLFSYFNRILLPYLLLLNSVT